MEKIDLEIDDFINYCDYKGLAKVSLITINNYIRNMRVYFNYMYENRLIKTNPVAHIFLTFYLKINPLILLLWTYNS